ncbi:MAG: GNAT family protein [Pacificimonas sp.]
MFIRTERLLLRPVWAQDRDGLIAGLDNWNVAQMLGRLPWPYGLAEANAFIAIQEDMPAHRNSLSIFLRTPSRLYLVGGASVEDRARRGLELGYWIAESHWGQGIAVEAASAMLEMAFLSLRAPVVSAGHYVDNPASGKVLRKLGFQATGEIRAQFSVSRNAHVDCVEYALTRGAWSGRHSRAAT